MYSLHHTFSFIYTMGMFYCFLDSFIRHIFCFFYSFFTSHCKTLNLLSDKSKVLLIILNLCSPYIYLSLLLPNRRKENVLQYETLVIKVRIYANHYIKAGKVGIYSQCGYSVYIVTRDAGVPRDSRRHLT